ncbi:3371_t:CDS:1, partial [Cetraspora pellucida]
SQHAAIIASWIDRKDIIPDAEKSSNHSFYNPSQIPYKFKLLVRGSRDGFSPTIFHKLCDRVRSTVTLFKLANSDNFVGGYSPEVWDSPLWPKYKSSDKAFIFSFTQGGSNLNGQRNNNGKIGRVTDHVYALNCWRYNGPSFGKCDLIMHNGGILRFKHQTFSPQIMSTESTMMKIEDYEVFEIVEKIKDKNNTTIS